jgi:hypothetical protein
VREGIQITESALKLAGLGAKNLAALLIALANDNQKLAGKTNLKRLIHDGEELTIFSVKQEDLKGFQMEAKRYGVLFYPIINKVEKTGTPDNAEVGAVTEKLMASLPVEIQTNAEKVRKFFLEEIAPLTLAIAVGESQVKDVLKQVTNGGTVDTSTFAKFDKMAHEAVMLRMAAFLENYLKLGDGASARLLVPASSSNNKQSAAPPNSKEEETPPGFRRLARSLEKLAAAQDRGGKNGPVAG